MLNIDTSGRSKGEASKKYQNGSSRWNKKTLLGECGVQPSGAGSGRVAKTMTALQSIKARCLGAGRSLDHNLPMYYALKCCHCLGHPSFQWLMVKRIFSYEWRLFFPSRASCRIKHDVNLGQLTQIVHTHIYIYTHTHKPILSLTRFNPLAFSHALIAAV